MTNTAAASYHLYKRHGAHHATYLIAQRLVDVWAEAGEWFAGLACGDAPASVHLAQGASEQQVLERAALALS